MRKHRSLIADFAGLVWGPHTYSLPDAIVRVGNRRMLNLPESGPQQLSFRRVYPTRSGVHSFSLGSAPCAESERGTSTFPLPSIAIDWLSLLKVAPYILNLETRRQEAFLPSIHDLHRAASSLL
jgi:hypothetical protein